MAKDRGKDKGMIRKQKKEKKKAQLNNPTTISTSK